MLSLLHVAFDCRLQSCAGMLSTDEGWETALGSLVVIVVELRQDVDAVRKHPPLVVVRLRKALGFYEGLKTHARANSRKGGCKKADIGTRTFQEHPSEPANVM